MHNFALSLNPSLSQLRTNLEIVEQAVSADMYRHWVGIGEMENSTFAIAATKTAAASGIPGHWLLPEGAGATGVVFNVPKHPEWKDGMVWVTIFYGVNGTSAGNIVWRIDHNTYEEGTAFAGFTVQNLGALAAPTTSGTIHKLDLVNLTSSTHGYAKINPETIFMRFRIGRLANDASDTNTNGVRIFGAVVNYKESKRQL